MGGGQFYLVQHDSDEDDHLYVCLGESSCCSKCKTISCVGGGQLALAVTHIMLLCYHLPAACTTSPMVAVRFFLGRVSVSTATSNEHDHDRSAATA